MMNKATDNEIIQEATEAIEKNLNAGCYVGDLLRIVKEQQAEIERLKNAYKQCAWERDVLGKSEAYREFCKERGIRHGEQSSRA